jgi:hypothetical protein
MGISFDAAGNLFVSEFGNSRVQKWDTSGGYLTKWGIFGMSEGRLDWPYGVAVNSQGNIYVVDSRNNRVQVFSPPLPAAYDANGAWTFSWTNKRIVEENGFICEPAANSRNSITLTQNGQYVSITDGGTGYSGFVSGATYNFSAADILAADEIISEEFSITLASQTAGSGNSFTAVTDNMGSYCLGEGDIAITKQAAGGGGGGGGGGCFISTILP